MRGFSAVGLHKPKDAANVGGALRAAHCYGASLVAIASDRSPNKGICAPTNTTRMERHVPIIRGEDLAQMIPYGSVPVAVDLVEGAISLPVFHHPLSAFYIFGPEDGTLSKPLLDWCAFRVMVPTQFCMNLAACVNVVLYDRLAKQSASIKKAA